MSNTGHKGISYRSEQDRFQIRVQWYGVKLSGTAGSLEEAIKMRNDFERDLGKPRTERRILAFKEGARVRGVTMDPRLNVHGSAVFQARWSPRLGEQRSTNFSIAKHGYFGAKRLAAEKRSEMVRKHYGVEI